MGIEIREEGRPKLFAAGLEQVLREMVLEDAKTSVADLLDGIGRDH